MEYFEFRAMNSDIVLGAEGEPNAIAQGFAEAREFIETSEARFTRFTNTSELAALNRSEGNWIRVSADLFELVGLARWFVDETAGLFDPSILDALEWAGYDRSMDEIRQKGVSAGGAKLSDRAPDIRAIELDTKRSAIRLPRGLRLDLGGIAKGWIAEHAAERLAQHAAACAVSAGGDIFLCGLPSGAATWEIAVEDPRAPALNLATMHVRGGAVATSSVVGRSWQKGARRMHHLIDPRTREPAETDWLSVTVMAPELAGAEVLAKALLIAGSRGAEAIAARWRNAAYLAVDGEGKLWASERARAMIEPVTA